MKVSFRMNGIKKIILINVVLQSMGRPGDKRVSQNTGGVKINEEDRHKWRVRKACDR